MRRLAWIFLLIAQPAWAQTGAIDWSAPGGTWDAGETVQPADLNEVKTEVDACFSTADGGTLSSGVLTLNAAASPLIEFDDSVATDAGEESQISADAVADDNGRIQLKLEAGADNTYVTAFSVSSTAGVVSGTQSGKVDRNDIAVDDDDCTGEQGLAWYDTTDQAFEFCQTNSGEPKRIAPIVQTSFWHGNDILTDGTECTAAAATTINSGPREYVIACPMTSSETDGFLYGSISLADSIDISADVIFVLYAYIQTDSGAGTWHAVVQAQCSGANATLDSTGWSAEAQLDRSLTAGLVQFQPVPASSDPVDLGFGGGAECAAGDSLFWRIKVCDTDATPSTGCTSNAGFENDLNIYAVKMEYTSLGGD